MAGGKSIAKDYRINQAIRASRAVVISDKGEQLGVMPIFDALRLAREQGLDLVEVSPNSNPPVCRILDYGKLKYLQAKKEREARKAQKSSDIREVRFRPNIGEHDFLPKLRKVEEFLQDGDKVKVSVFFRGREMAHQEQGIALLKKVADNVKDSGKVEKPPIMEGRALSINLTPLPARVQKQQPQPTKEEAIPEVKQPEEVKHA